MSNRIEFQSGALPPDGVALQSVISDMQNAYDKFNDMMSQGNQADYGSDIASFQALFGFATQADATSALSLMSSALSFLQTSGNTFLEMLSRMGME